MLWYWEFVKKHKIQFLNPDVHFKYLRQSEQDFFSFLSISIIRAAFFFLWMVTFSRVNVDARQPTHARMNAIGYQFKVQSWHKHLERVEVMKLRERFILSNLSINHVILGK